MFDEIGPLESAIDFDIKPNALKYAGYDETTGILKFSTLDDKITYTIDLPIESIVTNIEFDAESEEVVFTLHGGVSRRIPAANLLNPAWVKDVSEGGSVPPTAEAVQNYVADGLGKKLNKLSKNGRFVYAGYMGKDTSYELNTNESKEYTVPYRDGKVVSRWVILLTMRLQHRKSSLKNILSSAKP